MTFGCSAQMKVVFCMRKLVFGKEELTIYNAVCGSDVNMGSF